jgi:hypothetical protein
MDYNNVEILHDHYKDSCSLAGSYRSGRDRYFYIILVLFAVVLFDLHAPKDFSKIASEVAQKKLELSVAFDLRYLKSIIWFLVLGVTVRYCQAALLLERQYSYIHSLEHLLASYFAPPAFTREGKAYLDRYPAFSTWAHYLYTLVFPLGLMALVIYRTLRELPCCHKWVGLDWFDSLISISICVSVVLYLFAFHRRQTRRDSD